MARLCAMDYEKDEGCSSEQLIFPNKIEAKGNVKRISEQELRFLFVEEFKKANPDLFYSIETPTVDKFKFGKLYETIKCDLGGQSASHDMCIFERKSDGYNRILNIEFKHTNSDIKKTGKDILKLIQEKQDGAFIQLLNNTDKGTLCNKGGTGVFNKFYKSFSDFQSCWNNADKSIQLIIFSLKQKTVIHRYINKADLLKLEDIFFAEIGCGNITEVKGNGWEIETII